MGVLNFTYPQLTQDRENWQSRLIFEGQIPSFYKPNLLIWQPERMCGYNKQSKLILLLITNLNIIIIDILH